MLPARPGIPTASFAERRIQQQSAHADDAVEGRAYFMGGHRKEARLGAVGGIGLIAGLAERTLGLGAIGYVAAGGTYCISAGWPASVRTRPSLHAIHRGPERASDLLVVDPGTGWLERGGALLKDNEFEGAADQRAARLLRQFAKRVVDECDAALGIAQNDQVALGFEQTAGAFLGFLQFPIAVGQGFVV